MTAKNQAQDLFVIFYERMSDGFFSKEAATEEAVFSANVVCDTVIASLKQAGAHIDLKEHWGKVKSELKSIIN